MEWPCGAAWRWRHERNHPGTYGRRPGESIHSGLVTYGSDSGHQAGFGFGGPPEGFGKGPGGAKGGPPGGFGKGPDGAKGPGAEKGPGAPPAAAKGPGGPAPSDDWGLNDEAIKNLGYMQMKKTHDAAMVLIQRMYGERPKYNYYIGTSQGGREALTVAQR